MGNYTLSDWDREVAQRVTADCLRSASRPSTSTKIAPIPTHYKGYRFRSRLEAKWAVFFDKIGADWTFEEEGFLLQDGTPYLPDFYLRNVFDRFGRSGLFVEIKGKIPNPEENKKIDFLSDGLEQSAAIFVDDPYANHCEVNEVSYQIVIDYSKSSCDLRQGSAFVNPLVYQYAELNTYAEYLLSGKADSFCKSKGVKSFNGISDALQFLAYYLDDFEKDILYPFISNQPNRKEKIHSPTFDDAGGVLQISHNQNVSESIKNAAIFSRQHSF